MPSVANLSSDSPGRPGREMTGRTVLGWIIGFFAVIFLANAVFLWLAISSFSGIEATSAYKAGQTFASDKAMAEAQAERGWKVSTEIVRAGTGADVRLSARDIAGAPVGGVRFLAVFKRPVDDGHDVTVDLQEREIGVYRGHVDNIDAGQWNVVISAQAVSPSSGESEQVYLSRNRVVIRD